jgi:5-oxoprolinase (ATP-hydrolysing)
MFVGILSERRVLAPRGYAGGGDGERGLNLLIRKSGHVVTLGPKNTAVVYANDRLRILTPGGGAFGKVDDEEA